jgi:hypothetical protein
MNKYLQAILFKRGIDDVSHLRADEKDEFARLQRMTDRVHQLETEFITVEGIEKFCRKEKEEIEKQWHDNVDVTDKKEIYLKVQHKIYDSLIKYIKSPKAEREQLINYLEGLAK